MEARNEFIEMHRITSSSSCDSEHEYEQINKSAIVKDGNKQSCLNSFLKISAIVLISSVIVALFVFGWSFKQSGTPSEGVVANSTNSTSNITEYSSVNFFHPIKDRLNFDDSPCGDWITYRDEKCYRLFDESLQTFDEAVKSCANSGNSATLPTIHSVEEQTFLSNYLFKIARKVESFWIGAKFANNKFQWIDNTELSYSNWMEKGPKRRANYCVKMQAEEEFVGKWTDESCDKKNFVVCQKLQSWSFTRLQKTLFEVRQELIYQGINITESNKKIHKQKLDLEEANRKISELKYNLQESNLKIDFNKQNLISVGFIYAQLPYEKPPTEIWPWMTWTDMSATYAGVFFRVNGGNAAAFGRVQQCDAPKLEEVYTGDTNHLKTPGKRIEENNNNNLQIPISNWSQGIYTGSLTSSQTHIYIHFKQSTGEVRPRNMAIRIWKRTS